MLIAAIMTLALFVGLTLVALFVKVNYFILFSILMSVAVSMMMFGIFCWIAWSPVLFNLYCALGVIACSIYIIIDTQIIVGGSHSIQLSTDDWAVGALILYMDIIRMFLYILMLLGKK